MLLHILILCYCVLFYFVLHVEVVQSSNLIHIRFGLQISKRLEN
jgi:hypothetical protein